KFKKILKGLASFKGVERRLEYVGEKNNIKIIDDYGHHPTEIMATLDAVSLRQDYKRIIVVFQPHRYSRTKILFRDFKDVFNKAHSVIITKIYPAGEKKIKGVTAQLIFRQIKNKNKFFISSTVGIIDKLKEITQPGDIVMTLGAGDIKFLGKELLKKL
ncbi:MAG: UDP-N-acetylmuramate--L-alanine ligase, partial [Spirochaetes bacterium]|nr:UDP-N-acetylmuramate--L-alanine ligase [Spirochaetota bacterium]